MRLVELFIFLFLLALLVFYFRKTNRSKQAWHVPLKEARSSYITLVKTQL